ncbi:membrane protein [Flexivirga endophytica]|uniref:Membrane protein n=1 Tax=Flexivirga endophytica TaxID=1849103 RepID=A0A916X1N8_9MICO|nr:Bax inhibitor-1/YccA family protein [Flexivirga endophytica]GGB48296.1 membrane protein [Flexivirga endophytica]GHB61238.1 membrane protein [Flexivirga endophytica]
MASNPVFNRFNDDLSKGRVTGAAQPQYGQFSSPEQQQQARYGQQGGYPGFPQQPGQSMPDLEKAYDAPAATGRQAGRMTLDDVVTKTLGLFGVLLVFAAIGWFVGKENQSAGMALWLGGMFVGLALGFVISFKRVISVPLILLYAVCEGLFVGAASGFFNRVYPGVVAEAVLATLCVFAGMFAGWKFGLIRVTERSRKIFGLMAMGYLLFALVNVALVWTGVLDNPFGVGGNGPLGIIISIFAVGLASYSLAVDFDSIQRGVAAQLPEKYSWLMAHGLLVSVVWLYIELLRLFARIQSR